MLTNAPKQRPVFGFFDKVVSSFHKFLLAEKGRPHQGSAFFCRERCPRGDGALFFACEHDADGAGARVSANGGADVGLQRLRKLTMLGQAVPHGLQAAFLG